MSSSISVTEASQIRLSKEHIDIASGAGADIPTEALELASKLLQRNHDEHHILFKDVGGHNHTVHNVLTRIALGASPAEIVQWFNDNLPGQRPVPEVDNQIIQDLYDEDKFYEKIYPMNQKQYTNFLVFFEQQIEQKGWKPVVTEYVFSRSRNADAILGLMYDGAFHSLIHLGLGIEFQQPSLIAEALAQAAIENSSNISQAFLASEQEALKSGPADPSKPLIELIHEARANDTIRNAPEWSHAIFKMRDGVLAKAGPEIRSLMAQFQVTPETLERRTAEMISVCAFFAGAAQRPRKAHRIDFFYMHCVTSSIFLTVFLRQPWIRTADKVRLVEWKGRIDLAWYASCGAPELDAEYIAGYKVPDGDSSWSALFRAVNATHDDGHVAKFVRSLKNGAEVSEPFLSGGEEDKAFPVRGDMWLKLGWLSYDSTVGQKQELKWLFFPGFDQAWAAVPDRE